MKFYIAVTGVRKIKNIIINYMKLILGNTIFLKLEKNVKWIGFTSNMLGFFCGGFYFCHDEQILVMKDKLKSIQLICLAGMYLDGYKINCAIGKSINNRPLDDFFAGNFKTYQ